MPSCDGRKEGFIMKKYCTRCGHEFEAVGREVICPECKAHAAEDAKRAAVLKAKRASWTGESVPVRISGRASTVIRQYGAEKSLPFAAALDALLKSTNCFKGMNMSWEDITPYKSHRRDKHVAKHAVETQDGTQTTQGAPQAHDVKQAAKTTSKTSTSKAKTTSKASASKASKASASKKG